MVIVLYIIPDHLESTQALELVKEKMKPGEWKVEECPVLLRDAFMIPYITFPDGDAIHSFQGIEEFLLYPERFPHRLRA